MSALIGDENAFMPRRELRAMLRLALPVVVAQLGLTAFGVVDTMMLGHYSRNALAAAGAGHIYTMLFLLVGLGMLMGLDPLLAQAVGAGRLDRMAAHFRRGLVLSIVLGILATLAMLDPEPLLRLLRQDERVVPAASSYIRIVSIGNLGFLLTGLFRQGLQAQGIVRPMVTATLLANLFNALGNWALIFGRFGLPEMGLEGSAWVTAASRWLLFLALLALSHRHWRPWMTVTPGETRRGYASLLYLGLPLAVQVSLEAGIFNAVGFIMGAIGEIELSANQVTLNLASLVFMVPMGIGAAASTRVGNAIGAGRSDEARAAARVAFALGLGFMLVSGATFVAAPGFLASLYTKDAATLALAASLLPIAGFFAVFDGTQVVAHGILRGAADTRFPALMSLLGYWVLAMPVGLWLTFRGETWAPGLWWGLTIGLGFVALLLGLRIRSRFAGELAAFDRD